MSKFPVYDQLVQMVAQRPPVIDWKKWLLFVGSLNEHQVKYLYVIIMCYAMSEGKMVDKKPPYGGKTFDTGKGITYQANNLPVKLQQLITAYLEVIAKK